METQTSQSLEIQDIPNGPMYRAWARMRSAELEFSLALHEYDKLCQPVINRQVADQMILNLGVDVVVASVAINPVPDEIKHLPPEAPYKGSISRIGKVPRGTLGKMYQLVNGDIVDTQAMIPHFPGHSKIEIAGMLGTLMRSYGLLERVGHGQYRRKQIQSPAVIQPCSCEGET